MSVPTLSLVNQLLIALPSLTDPHFARSVALICQHDGNGAMGVVLNRASEYRLGEVLFQMGIETASDALREQVVLAGGPVHPDRGFVIHDSEHVWNPSLQIGGDFSLTTSRDVLAAMAEGCGPRRAVVALGCAGWGAGQLEFELGENNWLMVPADTSLLFDTPLDQRWQRAAGRIGVDLFRLTGYTGHA
ncbi:MAG TPA: YqgE/AlgH family protein [Xylella sp.]